MQEKPDKVASQTPYSPELPGATEALLLVARATQAASRNTDATAAIQRLGEAVQSAIGPTTEALKQLSESMSKIVFELPDMSGITSQIEELHRRLAPAFERIAESWADLPPRTREALLTMANHGWYMDMHMPMSMLWDVEEQFLLGDVAATEAELCDYFETRLDALQATAIRVFPERAHLINAAVAAHRQEQYALSVPVLLAQVDGICKQTTGGYFFIRVDKRPQIAAYIEVTDDSLTSALLTPLSLVTPINMTERERDPGFDALNRHQVLHGETLDYDSRVNSLKAVSLMNYVIQVLAPDATMNA